jgi:ferredoxin
MSAGTKYRLSIDPERCVGHGRCYDLAPALFAPEDDEGHARVLVQIVPADQLERARMAVASCPEGAVILDEA